MGNRKLVKIGDFRMLGFGSKKIIADLEQKRSELEIKEKQYVEKINSFEQQIFSRENEIKSLKENIEKNREIIESLENQLKNKKADCVRITTLKNLETS